MRSPEDSVLAWIAVPLAFAALLMDWLDGYAARRLGCESKVGGLLDIVGDRIAEKRVVGGVRVAASDPPLGASGCAEQGVRDGRDS